MRNPNNNPLISDPNSVNRSAPHYYQSFAKEVTIVGRDTLTGDRRQYDLKNEAARDKLYGKRRTLNSDLNSIHVTCLMKQGVDLPEHTFEFTFDNWEDVLALLQNTLWLT